MVKSKRFLEEFPYKECFTNTTPSIHGKKFCIFRLIKRC